MSILGCPILKQTHIPPADNYARYSESSLYYIDALGPFGPLGFPCSCIRGSFIEFTRTLST